MTSGELNNAGAGFMNTVSTAVAQFRANELLGLGFISEYTIADAGFYFTYTELGYRFARAVREEAQEVGLSDQEYVDIFVKLQGKGAVNGEEEGESR